MKPDSASTAMSKKRLDGLPYGAPNAPMSDEITKLLEPRNDGTVIERGRLIAALRRALECVPIRTAHGQECERDIAAILKCEKQWMRITPPK